MKPSSWRVVVVAAVVTALSSVLPPAGAGGCSVFVSPNPGWLGATITFRGVGLTPGVGYSIYFDGGLIKNGTVASSPPLLAGRFSYSYTIPNLPHLYGNKTYMVTTTTGCHPMASPASYTVLLSEPATTTTTPAVTTTAAVTTSGPVATTTAAVTTSAPVATTTAGVTTVATTSAPDSDVTVTTLPSSSGTTVALSDSSVATTIAAAAPETTSGGGTSPVLLVLLAALVGSLIFVGIRLGGRRQ